MQVSPSASDGVHKLKAAYKTKVTGVWVVQEFSINVQSRYAILAVDKVASQPAVISPGETAAVTVSVKNFANSVMRDVKLSLALSPNFIPVNSSDERAVNEIGPYETANLVFYVQPVPGADGGGYSVPIKLLYSDGTGKNYSRDSNIGLVVGSSPNLVVLIDSTEIYTKGQQGKVVFKFTNEGLTAIKFLNVMLIETSDFRVLSVPEVYAGKVDSDDYETTEFKIFVSNGKGSVTLPLELEYRDVNNQLYVEQRNIELKLYSLSEARGLGLVKGSGFTGIIIVLLIVGVGYFAYRKWKSRSKNEKK